MSEECIQSLNIDLTEKVARLNSHYVELEVRFAWISIARAHALYQRKYAELSAGLLRIGSPPRTVQSPAAFPAETQTEAPLEYPYKDEARGVLALCRADARNPKSLRKKVPRVIMFTRSRIRSDPVP